MASFEKKAGFLNGLLEGMDLDKNSTQGKLLNGIVGLLSELCDRTEAMDELLNDLNEYVESIDDDLSRLEQKEGPADGEDDFEFFDEDYDDDLPFGGEPPLRLLAERNKHRDDEAETADEEESSMDGGICPECQRLSFIESGDPEGLFVCPHCGKKVHLIPLAKDNTPIAVPAEED